MMNELDAHCHDSLIQHRYMQDKKLEFNALAAELYRLTNERTHQPIKTDYEKGTNRRRASDYCSSSLFQTRLHGEGDNHGSTL